MAQWGTGIGTINFPVIFTNFFAAVAVCVGSVWLYESPTVVNPSNTSIEVPTASESQGGQANRNVFYIAIGKL